MPNIGRSLNDDRLAASFGAERQAGSRKSQPFQLIGNLIGKAGFKKTYALGTLALLASCSQVDSSAVTLPAGEEAIATKAAGSGTLVIRANGEDFVRKGFTSKDGWDISFDHVYVTMAEITAAQADLSDAAVTVAEPVTVDLAAGDAEAEPIVVAEKANVPAGHYNALSWQLKAIDDGPAAGAPIVMIGTAQKADETVPFEVRWNESVAFACGDFVGEQRKGIVKTDQSADIEATFHFDHIFGDGSAPKDDDINTGALGFEPLAALRDTGTTEGSDRLLVDSTALEAQLSEQDFQTLEAAIVSLGHVGEGHCEATI